MTSSLLSNAVKAGRVVVRKNRKVSGEVGIHFMDPGLNPIHLTNFHDVVLTELPGIDATALQRSNLRKLQALGLIEVSS